MERLTTKWGGTNQLKSKVNIDCASICEDTFSCEVCLIQKAIDKLAEYEDLEEQGLLLKLHFAIGDVVYEVVEGADGGCSVVARKCRTKTLLVALNEKVGKTVFLTKSEAENALAEMGCE